MEGTKRDAIFEGARFPRHPPTTVLSVSVGIVCAHTVENGRPLRRGTRLMFLLYYPDFVRLSFMNIRFNCNERIGATHRIDSEEESWMRGKRTWNEICWYASADGLLAEPPGQRQQETQEDRERRRSSRYKWQRDCEKLSVRIWRRSRK